MNSSAVIAAFCRELHPEAETDAEAVLAHQKELQRLIDFKIKYDIASHQDIEMYFALHQVWNQLKAQELLEEKIV